ncbi:MAG: heme o synthase [Phycisphaerales bacterium]|nr:heme o synthase [Phycisphaerales bacterium]
MTTVPSTLSKAPLAVPDQDRPGLWADYVELTKARLSAMVVLTAAVGFMVAAPSPIPWTALVAAVVGTALAAGSAAVLNQLWEARRDALMERTRFRPLPARRIGTIHALSIGVLLGYAGTMVLAMGANLLAAGLALGNILLYVLAYTPMKPRTTLNTLVGAVCGAVPPMIGWAAATGSLGRGAWLLAAVLFVWQLPHFLSLAWLYRDDYRRGGHAMLPVVDVRGRVTCEVIVLTSALLVPLGLLIALAGLAGPLYAAVALVLGLGMSVFAVRMLASPTDARARAVFLASITYLPLLMFAMLVDRGTPPTSADRGITDTRAAVTAVLAADGEPVRTVAAP